MFSRLSTYTRWVAIPKQAALFRSTRLFSSLATRSSSLVGVVKPTLNQVHVLGGTRVCASAFSSSYQLLSTNKDLQAENSQEEAEARLAECQMYSNRGDYEEALNRLDAALSNVVHLGPELPMIGMIRRMAGLLLWEMDEFELAREQLEMFFNVSEIPGPIDWSRVKLNEEPEHELHAIAQCYAELEPERFMEGIPPLEILYDIQVKEKDVVGMAESATRIGILHHMVERETAEQDGREDIPGSKHGDDWINLALKSKDEVEEKDLSTMISINTMIAKVYESVDVARAAKLYEDALVLMQKYEQKNVEMSPEDDFDTKTVKFETYNGLANAYFHMDDFEKTVKNLNGALKTIRQAFNDDEYNLHAAAVLHGLARTYEHFKQNGIYVEGFYNNAISTFEHPDNMEDLFDDEDHTDIYISCLEDYAAFMRGRGRIDNAEEAEIKMRKHQSKYAEHVRAIEMRRKAEELIKEQNDKKDAE
eukprot:CFRG5115T1